MSRDERLALEMADRRIEAERLGATWVVRDEHGKLSPPLLCADALILAAVMRIEAVLRQHEDGR